MAGLQRWTVAVAGALVPLPALAGNELHPRTPVVWSDDTPCVEVIDKAETTVLELTYAIPYPDLEPTADEVADSRTHQFIATCRDVPPRSPLPGFISVADVEAALATGVLHPDDVDEEDILETSTPWAGCWVRITGDDERRPISEASASEPVRWDLTSTPPGVYKVHGFTHEPAFNLWTTRPGVVRIVDGAEPVGPAVAISTGALLKRPLEATTIDGCVVADDDGLELRGSWRQVGTEAWVPIDEPVVREGGSFSLTFPAPEVPGEHVIQIQAAGYAAYMADALVVLPAPASESEGGPEATAPAESTGCRVGEAGFARLVVLLAFISRRRRSD